MSAATSSRQYPGSSPREIKEPDNGRAARSAASRQRQLAKGAALHWSRALNGISRAAPLASRYQQARLTEAAAAKSVNLEVGTLRAILRHFRVWADLQPDVRMLSTTEAVGRVISVEEERGLLTACGATCRAKAQRLFPHAGHLWSRVIGRPHERAGRSWLIHDSPPLGRVAEPARDRAGTATGVDTRLIKPPDRRATPDHMQSS